MDQAVVEKFLNEVPYEIRAATMELKTDARWAVYIALTLEGRKYFNEIRDEFNANPNTIGPILKALVDGGLVAKKISKLEDMADKRKVFYEPTNMGIRLFDALNDVVIPKRQVPPELHVKTTTTLPPQTTGPDARGNAGMRGEYVTQQAIPLLRFAIGVEGV